MERPLKSRADAVKLLQLSELLYTSARTVVEEWSKEKDPVKSPSSFIPAKDNGSPKTLPSPALHEAQRTILAISGQLTELVSEANGRIIEVACQYWESRALFIAAERHIPDLLAEAGEKGLTSKQLADATGIEALKLSRILRCLCSIHIFKQVGQERFANNTISAALVNNEPLRSYVLLFNLDLFSAAEHLPRYLLGPKGSSYKVEETAWQEAIGTEKARWDWLEEKISPDSLSKPSHGYSGVPNGRSAYTDGVDPITSELVSRPEHEVFGLAMIGGGRTFGAAHPYDYPWDALGKATIVDVGGGLGGFPLQLSSLYPKLKFVIQDRERVLNQGKNTIWPQQNPKALRDGRVQFTPHDFFEVQPVKGAEVYWLRYVIHDWSDDYCIQILSAIASSMSVYSRVLICEQIMSTTLGDPKIRSAPSPLPSNYGYYTRYSHQRDLCMMGIINGIERTPEQFARILEASGLYLEKIWECRSQVGIIEARKVWSP